MKNTKASSIAILAVFVTIMVVIQRLTEIVYAVWPVPIQPTLMHIPVIIGSIVLGAKKGAFLGFVMGLYSFLFSTLSPIPSSFLFTPFQPNGNIWSLVIAFVPRILVGILPFYVYKTRKDFISAGGAGFVGAATNTILVLGGIYLFFGKILNQSFGAFVAGIITLNSIVEILASVVLTAAVVPVLTKIHD